MQMKEEADEQNGQEKLSPLPSSVVPLTTPLEATVSVVPLPNEQMKGRIIGREGHKVRPWETIARRRSHYRRYSRKPLQFPLTP